MRPARRPEGLGLWLLIVGLALAGFWFAFRHIEPPPPETLTMASGTEQGAYHGFALRYREILARDGIELVVRPTAGSLENMQLLNGGQVDVAFVQGGTGVAAQGTLGQGPSAEEGPLQGLASLYYEPLWIFHRSELSLQRLPDLAGLRVQVGAEGSGTRAVALALLAAHELVPAAAAAGDATQLAGSRVSVVGLDTNAAIEELLSGGLDALFLVGSPRGAAVQRLMAEEGRAVRLLDMEQHAAYTANFHFLRAVTADRGQINLARDLPGRPVRLLAPTATLVGTGDLHPALIPLLIQAAQEVHGKGNLFEAEGEFPSPLHLDVPLSKSAEQYFKSGPSFLYRVLPFGVAAVVDRLKILLLPLLTLLLPLMRIAPPIYRWRIRSKIYRWYKSIRQLELDIETARRAGPEAGSDKSQAGAPATRLVRAELLQRIQAIDHEIDGVRVPASYMAEFYNLRAHLDWVRARLG
ncbi:MAG: TAXI family TRAP transporter solute-binding subunit [Planctomycetota bacterium]